MLYWHGHQLSKFISNCTDLLHPLTVLLSKKNTWTCGPSQEEALTTLKISYQSWLC